MRWLLIGGFLASALMFAVIIGRNTFALADYHVFVEAGNALIEAGDPYLPNADAHFEFHYRYPPLLAMLMPGLRWIWYPLLALGIAGAIYLRYRATGSAGLGLPTHLTSILVSNLVNGNAQGLVIGIGSLGPLGGRTVAVLFAFSAWIKLYPACILIWWLGRRDWRSIRWFGLAFLLLGAIQLPWLDEFVRYSATQTGLPAGLSLRAYGPVLWLALIAVLAWLTYSRANIELGWTCCVLLQLAVLPRILFFNIPLLLMAPGILGRTYSPMIEGSSRPREMFAGMALVIAVVTIQFLP